MIDSGVHLVEAGAVAALEQALPVPWWGVVELARAVEGTHPEPPPGQPLVVTGLVRCLAASEGAERVGNALRGYVMAGRGYFEWKRIPLVFVTLAALEGAHEEGGPTALSGGKRVPLAPFFGRSLRPKVAGVSSWWWAPQLG